MRTPALNHRLICYFGLLVFLFTWTACEDDTTTEGPEFDRSELLTHIADDSIEPNLTILANAANTLLSDWLTFQNEPTEAGLASLRSDWFDLYVQWQRSRMYNFGPGGAEDQRLSLDAELGTFPVDVESIENNINNETSLAESAADERGILALDYLFFGSNSTPEDFTDSRRAAYVTLVINRIAERTAQFNLDYTSGYREEFIRNDGTDAGSSVSQLYNAFVQSFEALKNFKLALPLGKRPGQQETEPERVEAFYAQRSLEGIRAHWAALTDLYYGRGVSGVNGPSFSDYLATVEGGSELLILTTEQIEKIDAVLATIPTDVPFSQLVAAEDERVVSLFNEMQRHTRFWKSDLSSLLGISITFASGDGD